MPASRPLFSVLALALLAGGILLEFFIILSGAVNGSPENQFYFLESTTNGISGARNPSRWTFFSVCGVDGNGRNSDCGAVVPALPFDPPRNFGTESNVPDAFVGTKRFFYLSRFMFAFYLVALVFAVIALFTGLLALFSRLGGFLSAVCAFVALTFQILAAALMTVWVVEGRNAFRSNGQDSHVGTKVMGFAWATMVCFFLTTILFALSGVFGGGSSTSSRRRGAFTNGDSKRKSRDDFGE